MAALLAGCSFEPPLLEGSVPEDSMQEDSVRDEPDGTEPTGEPALPPGTLDPAFGDEGVVSLADTLVSGADDWDRFVTVDRSGRILLSAVSRFGEDVDGLIWRIGEDGVPDRSFGLDGRVVQRSILGETYLETIVVAEDGDIFVTGSDVFSSREAAALLIRYGPDGRLRESFGRSGALRLYDLFSDCAEYREGTALYVGFGLAMDAGGRILLSGNGAEPDCSDRDMFAIRVDAETGAFDPSFGDEGRVRDQPLADAAGDGRTDNGRAIIEGTGGAILVAGNTNLTDRFASADAVLWRYLDDGSLDPSFGDRGRVIFSDIDESGGGSDAFYDLAMDAEGRVVAAGRSFSDDYDAVLVRVDPDGRRDPTFEGGTLIYDSGVGDDQARRVLIDESGRIVVAGVVSNGQDTDIAVWRLNPDGTADEEFGASGLFTYDGGYGDDDAHGLAIGPSGRIIVSGTVTGPSDDADIVLLALSP